jgi:ABC-type Fe3+-hydroxamate transport system substrate-binding protein
MNESTAGSSMPQRVVWSLIAGCCFLLAGWLLARVLPAGTSAISQPASEDLAGAEATPPKARLVSLAPVITETLLSLDASAELVGVSQFCRTDSLQALPRVGTSITPQLEAIARLEPTLILTSAVAGEQTAPLERLAPTKQLPWLTLPEVIESIKELSRLVGHPERGIALAGRMSETLDVEAPADAPRVLLTMSYGDTGAQEIWFMRRNSLHGALLAAAGGRNAVTRDVTGQPRLSIEELLRIDPDQIILLVDAERTDAAEAQKRLEPLRKLTPLKAVQTDRVGVLWAPNVFSTGPNILDLVEPLRREIRRLHAEP